MEYNKEIIDYLKEKIEIVAGRKIYTPRDFDYLAKSIFESTKQMISTTTLKRFWGYIHEKGSQSPRRHTLDLLSVYVGYSDYDMFCKFSKQVDGPQSGFLFSEYLDAKTLKTGDKVLLKWLPDRKVVVQYIGDCRFKVVEGINCKLNNGDIFRCEHIINGVPLAVSVNSSSVGEAIYICGKISGVQYELV
jgi:hypothetical protein